MANPPDFQSLLAALRDGTEASGAAPSTTRGVKKLVPVAPEQELIAQCPLKKFGLPLAMQVLSRMGARANEMLVCARRRKNVILMVVNGGKLRTKGE